MSLCLKNTLNFTVTFNLVELVIMIHIGFTHKTLQNYTQQHTIGGGGNMALFIISCFDRAL